MEKILYNLISNAVKYTPEGGKILISIGIVETLHATSLPNTQLEIKISDTGIGISPEDIDNIFDRFYRVPTNKKNKREGTGIGLAYTRELVELHKGAILVESEPDKGTSFILKFPVEQKSISDSQVPKNSSQEFKNNENLSPDIKENVKSSLNEETVMAFSQSPVNSGKSFSLDYIHSMLEENDYIHIAEESIGNQTEIKNFQSSVLLVEDNDDLRGFIKNELQTGYTVLEAENGEQAWEILFETDINLVISDIMMPVMDGMELCKKIKNDENTSHIPVILLTAKEGDENMLTGIKSGADDYITKPFNITILKAKINNILLHQKRLHDKFNKSIDVQTSEVTCSILDKKFLQKAIDVVNENMQNPEFSNDTFVKLMDCSRSLVYKKIKTLTNQSVSEFIRIMRLKTAAQLFQKGHDNVTEVCYMVGMKHLSDFTRYFSKQFGKTPTQFIKDKF